MACLGQGHLHDVDEETANLIIKLQIQDAELQLSLANRKGKGREGEITDQTFALQLQKQELENVALFFSNRRMTQSIASAVQTDGPLVMNTAFQENIAVRDRDLVQSLGVNAELPNVGNPNTDCESHELDDELLTKFKVLFVSDSALEQNPDLDEANHAESSTWAAGRSANVSETKGHCEACGDDKNFVDVGRAPCRHEYCRDCLQKLFKAAITDDSLFPPRCCRQPIPLETVRIFLTSELAQAFVNKKVEFETPNKTYCPVQTCSAFIGTGDIADNVGTCRQCGSTTCILCKTAAHDRGECSNDPALQQVLDIMKENGWQRCNSCSSVIELNHGCNHITCRCGSQFCYDCGLPWKTCTCVHWDEDRLLDRANQIVAREPGARRLNHGERAALVARTAQNLRNDHECNHFDWRFIREGGQQCEECRQTLRDFIFQCERCQLRACKRCKNNRLQG